MSVILQTDRVEALRARNKRTGFLLLSVVLVFGLGFVAKRLIFG
jgi:hypothetical protein